jgi:hypothetical protein
LFAYLAARARFEFLTNALYIVAAGLVAAWLWISAAFSCRCRILTAVSLAFSLATWWGLGLSVAFWVGTVAVLQRMGKADPLLRQIYARHVRYRPFYPAKSGLFSRCLVPPRAWR